MSGQVKKMLESGGLVLPSLDGFKKSAPNPLELLPAKSPTGSKGMKGIFLAEGGNQS